MTMECSAVEGMGLVSRGRLGGSELLGRKKANSRIASRIWGAISMGVGKCLGPAMLDVIYVSVVIGLGAGGAGQRRERECVCVY